MKLIQNKTFTHWTAAGLWTFFIYAMLPWALPLCNFLKQRIPFSFSIKLMFVVSLAFLTWEMLYLLRWRRSTILGLGLCLILSLLIFQNVRIPAERIHLLQYGLLAFLFLRALLLNWNKIISYLGALALTTLVGWGDEAIQSCLPNRYYQISDVLLNLLSGLVGLCWAYLGLHGPRRRGRNSDL